MSIRSDVLDVLYGRETNSIPWFGDLSYYYQALERQGKLEQCYFGAGGEKKFYLDYGVGIYLYTPDVFTITYSDSVTYRAQNDPDRIVLIFETPIGTIQSRQKYVDGMYCYVYEKHFVDSIEDLRVMRYVYEHAIYRENYDAYRYYDNLWGEDGIGFAMAEASMAPVQKLLSRWAGVETTLALFMDYPEEFEETCWAIENSQSRLVEVLAKSPAEVIILPENLASEVTGSYFFAHFNMPAYKKIIDRLHRAGKKVAIHNDGGLKPNFGLLEKCGFDIVEAVTPAPFGDIAVEDLRKAAGDNIIIWGGLPGGIFSGNYSEEFFEDYVNTVLACADNRFVLGVADQVPPDAVPERVRRVRELVRTHEQRAAIKK